MALVLRRREGDKIHISVDSEEVAIITVKNIGGGNVELVFDALDRVDIERGETIDNAGLPADDGHAG